MAIAAFFGHKDYNYTDYEPVLNKIIVNLIEKHDVTEFYNGYRGAFDRVCALSVYKLKPKYPHIKNTLVLSYLPDKNFVLPYCFDESVYLLERARPVKFAIWYTNRMAVDAADYIISGVRYDFGGAWAACDYARRRRKQIINLFDTMN